MIPIPRGAAILMLGLLLILSSELQAQAGPKIDFNPRFACPLRYAPSIRGADLLAREGGHFDSRRGVGKQHGGLDLNSDRGMDNPLHDTVFAVRGGKVGLAQAKWGEMGTTVILDHLEGSYTLYGHLDQLLVKNDADVVRGAPLGIVGYTGNAASLKSNQLPPHLHFGYFVAGRSGLTKKDGPLGLMKTWGDVWMQVLGGDPTTLAVGVLDPGMYLPRECYKGNTRLERNGYEGRPLSVPEVLRRREIGRSLASLSTYPLSTQRMVLAVSLDGLSPADSTSEIASRSSYLDSIGLGSPDLVRSALQPVERSWEESRLRRSLAPDNSTASISGVLATTPTPFQAALEGIREKTSNPVHEAVDAVINDAVGSGLSALVDPAKAAQLQRLALPAKYEDLANDNVKLQQAIDNLGAIAKTSLNSMPALERARVVSTLWRGLQGSTGNERLVMAGGFLAIDPPSAQQALHGVIAVSKLIEEVNNYDRKYLDSLSVITGGVNKYLISAAEAIDAPTFGVVNRYRQGSQDLVYAASVFSRQAIDLGPLGAADGSQAVRVATNQAARTNADVIRIANGYLDGANALLAGASKLGLNPKIVKTGQSVLKLANTASKLVSGLLSPNPLAAIGALGDLFGLGGPDVGEIRHQELLARFDQVDKKLDELKKGQDSIINLTLKLGQKIDALSKQVSDQHREEMEALSDLRRLAIWQIQILTNNETQALNACNDVDDWAAKTRSYEKFKEWVENQPNIAKCLDYLELAVDTDGYPGARSNLWVAGRLSNVADPPAQPDQRVGIDGQLAIGDSLKKIAVGGQHNWLNWLQSTVQPNVAQVTEQVALGAFRRPALTLVALSAKLEDLRAGRFNDEALSTEHFFLSLFPTAVASANAHARRAAGLYPLLDPTSLKTARQLSAFSALPARANDQADHDHRMISRWGSLINLAIAQQAMESGDLLLPFLADNITQKVYLERVKSNRVLLNNIARFIIYTSDNVNLANPLPYQFALWSKDARYLELLVQRSRQVPDGEGSEKTVTDRFKFVPLNVATGEVLTSVPSDATKFWWAISLNPDRTSSDKKFLVPMPTVEEFVAGRLVPTDALDLLLSERAATDRLLAELDVVTSDKVSRDVVAAAVLTGMTPDPGGE